MAKPTKKGQLGYFYDGGAGDRWRHNGTDWESIETIVQIKEGTTTPVTGMWHGTEAEYLALPTRDPEIIYFVNEAAPAPDSYPGGVYAGDVAIMTGNPILPNLFEMLVTATANPAPATIVGGTMYSKNLGGGVWKVSSKSLITSFKGIPTNAGVTKIEMVIMGGISSLEESFKDLSALVEFIMPSNQSQITDISNAWQSCIGLTSFPLIDTSSVTDMAQAWKGCTHLACFAELDTTSLTDGTEAFSNCNALVQPALTGTTVRNGDDAVAGVTWTNQGTCP